MALCSVEMREKEMRCQTGNSRLYRHNGLALQDGDVDRLTSFNGHCHLRIALTQAYEALINEPHVTADLPREEYKTFFW